MTDKVTKKLTATRESIKRWQRRAVRATNMLDRLLKYERRLMVLLEQPVKPKPPVVEPVKQMAEAVVEALAGTRLDGQVKAGDGGEIPLFLRRDGMMMKSPPTPEALAIEAEQAAKKAERASKLAKARAANRKAKLTGQTRKMPLTGKAALAAIRQSE